MDKLCLKADQPLFEVPPPGVPVPMYGVVPSAKKMTGITP